MPVDGSWYVWPHVPGSSWTYSSAFYERWTSIVAKNRIPLPLQVASQPADGDLSEETACGWIACVIKQLQSMLYRHELAAQNPFHQAWHCLQPGFEPKRIWTFCLQVRPGKLDPIKIDAFPLARCIHVRVIGGCRWA